MTQRKGWGIAAILGGGGRTYFTPTTGDDLGKINIVHFKKLDRDPQWVARKCRKTQFASAKNAPGKDYNKKENTDVSIDN